PNLDTGHIEVTISTIQVISKSKNLPFLIHEAQDVSEDLRLKYRYIDLRREDMQRTFQIRHKITKSIRHFLDNHDYLEMETPILTKSTPEGAREYLVPSRYNTCNLYTHPLLPLI